jgi:hypothetical protein
MHETCSKNSYKSSDLPYMLEQNETPPLKMKEVHCLLEKTTQGVILFTEAE